MWLANAGHEDIGDVSIGGLTIVLPERRETAEILPAGHAAGPRRDGTGTGEEMYQVEVHPLFFPEDMPTLAIDALLRNGLLCACNQSLVPGEIDGETGTTQIGAIVHGFEDCEEA